MSEWRDKSFFYCLRVLKHSKRITGTKLALHESALPVYDYIEKYFTQYHKYPSVKHVCTKFNITSSKYIEDGWTLRSLSDFLKLEQAKSKIQETQMSLQELLTDGNDHELTDYLQPMQTLFDGLTTMSASKPLKLSQWKSVTNKYMKEETNRVCRFGFKQLDRVTGGIRRANSIIIFANTSEGKSTFARLLAGNIASQGKLVLYITLEESASESVVKTATILAQVPANDVFDKKLSLRGEARLRRRMRKVKGDVVFVDRCDGVSGVATKLQQYKPDVVIIDQLSHLLPDSDYDWKVVNKTSKQLQRLCHNSKIPQIVLHQSTRESKKGAKQESAWGYGMIQDADLVMYLCPDEELEDGSILKRVNIPKARGRKKNVSIDFIWNLSRGIVAEMIKAVTIDNEVNQEYEA